MIGARLRQCFVVSRMPGALRFLAWMTLSFATPLRHTPALKGLRNTAQGCRALASAPLGQQHTTGKQTHNFATHHAHQQRLH